MNLFLFALLFELTAIMLFKLIKLGQKYLEHRKEQKFNQIRLEVLTNPRVLTRDEYRIVKATDWYNQRKFLISHLTETGFQMYNSASPRGSQGKWNVYLEIWELINTPLFRALYED